jgi:hypothetical protein
MNDHPAKRQVPPGSTSNQPPPLPQRVKAANVVPPGSTALREVLHAVTNALTLPTPATERDEVAYLRISRDHARELVWMCRRLLQGPRDFDDGDVMAVVNALRDKIGQLPADQYDAHPLEF